MSGWSPPSLSRRTVAAVVVGYVLIAAYSLVIAAQLLLGVILPGVVLLASYLLWRVLHAIEAIADALQRIADAQESDG